MERLERRKRALSYGVIVVTAFGTILAAVLLVRNVNYVGQESNLHVIIGPATYSIGPFDEYETVLVAISSAGLLMYFLREPRPGNRAAIWIVGLLALFASLALLYHYSDHPRGFWGRSFGAPRGWVVEFPNGSTLFDAQWAGDDLYKLGWGFVAMIAMLWVVAFVLPLFTRYSATRCRVCNYDLRGLTSFHCPECGERFADENE